jgi:mono/diheme cytochrome c family protein
MTSGFLKGWKAIGLALLAGGAALSSTLGVAAMVRRSALRTSHQQPTPEQWIEAATPTSPELVAKGRRLFLDSCAHCHGADAHGDEGPDLHGVQVSDRYIHNTITRGIKGEMPSFAKKHAGADITALTAYLRSLE